jgi:hypothetical protein
MFENVFNGCIKVRGKYFLEISKFIILLIWFNFELLEINRFYYAERFLFLLRANTQPSLILKLKHFGKFVYVKPIFQSG